MNMYGKGYSQFLKCMQSLEASTTSTRLSVVNMLISVFLPIIQHFPYYVCEL